MSPVRLRHIHLKAEELYVSIFDFSSNSAIRSKSAPVPVPALVLFHSNSIPLILTSVS
jgi:hypothetical protein